jgi:His/Glu/Gln/Arg/opine family amino acid ABC transporter permease subunit
MYSFDWSTVGLAISYIGKGLWLTLLVSITSLAIGIALALPIGILRSSGNKLLTTIFGFYVEIFRNIPVLVLIVWIYYVLPILTGYNLGPIPAGIIALGLNTSAFLAEVFRGGISGIAIGQREASASLGLTSFYTMTDVIIPQVIRRMMAPMLNQFIVLIKESALLSYIGVLEILQRGDQISTQFSRPLEAYTVVAMFYLVICFSVSQISRWIERRLAIPE